MRGEDGDNPPAHKFGFALHLGTKLHNALDDLVKLLETYFFVGHLTSPKLHDELDLISLVHKALGLAQFDLQVVGVNIGAELDLLEVGGSLLFAGLIGLFLLLVLVFAVVDEAHNWWIGIGGDLDQIEPSFFGDSQGLRDGDDSILLSLSTN